MSDRLTPQREAEIAARAGAATPGPWCTDSWEIYQGAEYVPGISEWIGETCRGATTLEQDRADAAFMAAARTDVPALLAELAAVRNERDEARAKVRELACPVCKGSGLDPDDEGDWDGAVGRHNPTTIAPCPTCMGDRTRQGGAR